MLIRSHDPPNYIFYICTNNWSKNHFHPHSSNIIFLTISAFSVKPSMIRVNLLFSNCLFLGCALQRTKPFTLCNITQLHVYELYPVLQGCLRYVLLCTFRFVCSFTVLPKRGSGNSKSVPYEQSLLLCIEVHYLRWRNWSFKGQVTIKFVNKSVQAKKNAFIT